MRKEPVVTGEVYHVYNKSIAGYEIFNTHKDYLRIIELIRYYQIKGRHVKFSEFKERNAVYPEEIISGKDKLVDIICYEPMPTHIHLVLRQLRDKGISKFINDILNSYTRYFNLKHNRKGPLWEGRFKKVLVETDEQLLHLTRYIHLNPVTAGLVERPEDWPYSSYREYISGQQSICNYQELLEIKPNEYKKFVDDRISYQKELAKIKHMVFD
jgi:putative transposase